MRDMEKNIYYYIEEPEIPVDWDEVERAVDSAFNNQFKKS